MPKIKTPVESFTYTLNRDGYRGRAIRLHSYVAILTEKDGCEVLAVRYDGYETKGGVQLTAEKEYPDWNVKGVWRLYDEDF